MLKQAHLEGFIVNWIQSFLLDSRLLFCILVFVRKKIGLHIPASYVGFKHQAVHICNTLPYHMYIYQFQ